jgi:hypothetical protein
MAKINFPIPEQNFEKVRDQIAIIITDEITEQLAQTGLGLFNPSSIFLERRISLDKTTLPAITITTDSADYDKNSATESEGKVKYLIVAYTSADSTSIKKGDEKSALDCEKLIGVLRFILKHPFYKYLNLKGVVGGVSVDSWRIGEPQQGDSRHMTVGEIQLSVIISESNGTEIPTISEGSDSGFSIGTSEQGYLTVVENT